MDPSDHLRVPGEDDLRRSRPGMASSSAMSDMQRALSSSSYLTASSSHTDTDVHSHLGNSSLSVNTVTAHSDQESYFWLAAPPEERPQASDAYNLFPTTPHVPPTANAFDDVLALGAPNSPLALFDMCIRQLRNEFLGGANPVPMVHQLAQYVFGFDYALSLAAFPSTPQTHHPTPNYPLSNNGSQPRTERFLCRLCTTPKPLSSRGAFKRHVSERHRPRSRFYCPLCFSWNHVRKDKLREHLQRRHQDGHDVTAAQIAECETILPVPPRCDLCYGNDLPFQSWDAWFECIESHCRIAEETPPDPDPELPDEGSGGAGGFGFNDALLGLQGPASGAGYPGAAAPEEFNWANMAGMYRNYSATSASPLSTTDESRPGIQTGTSTESNSPIHGEAKDSSAPETSPTRPLRISTVNRLQRDDVPAPRNDRHSNRKLDGHDIPSRSSMDSDDQSPPRHCSQCGHTLSSCSVCARSQWTGSWCHNCRGAAMQRFAGSAGLEKAIGRGRQLWLARERYAAMDLSQRSLSIPLIVFELKYRAKFDNMLTPCPNLRSIVRRPNSTVDACSDQRGSWLSEVISELDQTSLIFSINQLTLSTGYVFHYTDENISSTTVLDALRVGQRTLDRIHRNPCASRQIMLRHLQRCCVSLDAIEDEFSSAADPSAMETTQLQQRRRKRLSALWARLRAIAFVLSLQADVANSRPKTEHDDCPSEEQSLKRPASSRVSPFTITALRALYGLTQNRLGPALDRFYDRSTLLMRPKLQDPPQSVFCFLRMLLARISDTKSLSSLENSPIGDLYLSLLQTFNTNVTTRYL